MEEDKAQANAVVPHLKQLSSDPGIRHPSFLTKTRTPGVGCLQPSSDVLRGRLAHVFAIRRLQTLRGAAAPCQPLLLPSKTRPPSARNQPSTEWQGPLDSQKQRNDSARLRMTSVRRQATQLGPSAVLCGFQTWPPKGKVHAISTIGNILHRGPPYTQKRCQNSEKFPHSRTPCKVRWF